MSEKNGYIREGRNDIIPRRTNLCARAVIVPDEKLSSSTEVRDALSAMQINGSDLNLNTEDLEEGLSEELLDKFSEDEAPKRAREYLGYAQDSFHLLEEIERILDTKEKHGTTQILLAQSASQTEFAVLYHSIMRVYRHSCATSFEREKFIKDDNLILLAHSKGLAKFLPKDFVRTWKKTRVSMKKGQGRAEQLLTYFKENKGFYQQMIKELELFLAEESRKVAEAKGMNCF